MPEVGCYHLTSFCEISNMQS